MPNQNTERVSKYGLTSHMTYNRSFQRRVFPGKWLHWYWQPKTRKQNIAYTLNTQKNRKTALVTKHTESWYGIPARKWSRPYSYKPRALMGPKISNSKKLNNIQTKSEEWIQKCESRKSTSINKRVECSDKTRLKLLLKFWFAACRINHAQFVKLRFKDWTANHSLPCLQCLQQRIVDKHILFLQNTCTLFPQLCQKCCWFSKSS